MLPLHFSAITCQSSSVGDFLTAFSLGFILLMKFEFSYSEFIFLLVCNCSKHKHGDSVGKHVGKTYPAPGKKKHGCSRWISVSISDAKELNYHEESYFNSVKLVIMWGNTALLEKLVELEWERDAEVERRKGLQGWMVVR